MEERMEEQMVENENESDLGRLEDRKGEVGDELTCGGV